MAIELRPLKRRFPFTVLDGDIRAYAFAVNSKVIDVAMGKFERAFRIFLAADLPYAAGVYVQSAT